MAIGITLQLGAATTNGPILTREGGMGREFYRSQEIDQSRLSVERAPGIKGGPRREDPKHSGFGCSSQRTSRK